MRLKAIVDSTSSTGVSSSDSRSSSAWAPMRLAALPRWRALMTIRRAIEMPSTLASSAAIAGGSKSMSRRSRMRTARVLVVSSTRSTRIEVDRPRRLRRDRDPSQQQAMAIALGPGQVDVAAASW